MAVAASTHEESIETMASPAPRWSTRLAALGVVAIAASPIVVAALSFIGDAWYPVGDLASILFRTSQVGTRATPLVGMESIKGWAHPGPLEFYLANPLYRLSGEDPRALLWTASLINLACIGWLGRVMWRRGGWPLLAMSMLMVAVVLHGLGPKQATSLWNPLLPIIPFLLTVVLIWDAGMGRRRALVEAVVPATLAMQTHVSMISLCGVLVAWLVAWVVWEQRVLSPKPDGHPTTPLRSQLPDLWRSWRKAVGVGAALAALLWLGPLLDLLFDMQNLVNIAKSLATPPAHLGHFDALGLVGRYVRPDGPWMGGPEPATANAVRGSGPLPLLLVVGILWGCFRAGRRRHLTDVCALASLCIVLVVGSILATGQIVLPVYEYLTQWLKVVGGIVWLTVAWTLWRLYGDRLLASGRKRVAAGALACAAILSAAAWTWGDATEVETFDPTAEAAVQETRSQLATVLPRDERIRVEYRGDPYNINGPGVIYWLIHDGFDITTRDGDHGLKWGHEHRWNEGEEYDRSVTVVAHYSGLSRYDPMAKCMESSSVELIASHDTLSSEERAWLADVRFQRMADPDSVASDDLAKARALDQEALRLAVFEDAGNCAGNPPKDPDRYADRGPAPPLPVVLGGVAVAAGVIYAVRRRLGNRLKGAA